MPESRQKLLATLQELEAELASLESLDDETRSVLELVMDEIGETLGKQDAAQRPSHESLAARLQEVAEDFESSHPTLFGIVSRTIDALGQMGI